MGISSTITMKHASPMLMKRKTVIQLAITLSTSLTILSFVCFPSYKQVLLQSHLRRHFLNLTTEHSHCVMYDKTLRAASSTTLTSLRICWASQKYSFRRHRQVNKSFIQSAVERRDQPRVGLAGNHIWFTDDEVKLVLKECRSLFYVTSTRPMRDRLLSKAKFEVSNGKININTTLNEARMRRAFAKAMRDKKGERVMENYPFARLEIPPDYVIRYSMLKEDLTKLLEAFGCVPYVKNTNFHTFEADKIDTDNDDDDDVDDDSETDVDGDEDDEGKGGDEDEGDDEDDDDDDDDDDMFHSGDSKYDLNLIPLRLGDARHKRMLEHAEQHNAAGLIKAQQFRKPPRTKRRRRRRRRRSPKVEEQTKKS